MGFSRKRVGKDGKPRYTAYYIDIRGQERSAGTFGSTKAADKAWQKAEVELASGRIGDPRRGRQLLERYVRDEWLPNHVMEATTRQTTNYLLDRYIIPEFGDMLMVYVLPSHVREWIQKMQAAGCNPPTIQRCKVIIDSIFTVALNDQITFLHPGRGVKTPAVAKKTKRILNPEQFDTLYLELPDDMSRLLIETDIETGLRWGELVELRPRDFDFSAGVLTVSRVVVELNSKFHPNGERFLVKEYPKDKEWRSFRVASHLLKKILNFVAENNIGPDELIFEHKQEETARRRIPEQLPAPETLGMTDPNKDGKRFRHGTTSGYGPGGCRCRHCKDAIAAYRAERRAAGKDAPRRRRTVQTDGHIGRDWFRRNVWLPSLKKANLDFHVTPNGMRHAHASWLLAGGADLQVVKERLGHGSIKTTENYLHTLSNTEDAAINALASIRSRHQR